MLGSHVTIDWPALRAAATAVAGRAYAPYSRLRVGAAGLAPDGPDRHRLQRGERLLRADPVRRVRAGVGPARGAAAGPAASAVSVVAGDGAPLVPCGRCRQLLLEAGGPACCWTPTAARVELGELLPGAFTGADLDAPGARPETPDA